MTEKMDLRGRFEWLLTSSEFADCCFAFGETDGNHTTVAHKLVLAAASPVFRAMFFGELSNELPVKIVDIRPEIFQLVLRYIYTGDFVLTCDAHKLYHAADKYMLQSLKQTCLKEIDRTLCASNACKNYEFADIYDLEKLKSAAQKIIVSNTGQVLPSVPELGESSLLELLDLDELNISSELGLFDAVIDWGKFQLNCTAEQNKSLRSIVDKALKKVRFLTLKWKEFSSYPAKSEILTENERHHISMNILNKSTIFPMPDGFSANTQKRKLTVNFPAQPILLNQKSDAPTPSSRNSKDELPREIGKRMKELLTKRELTDSTFVIINAGETVKFDVHKLILSIASPVFRDMLSGRTPNDEPVKIEDISPQQFRILLEYMYTNVCYLSKVGNINEFALIAFKYGLTHLLEKCIDAMMFELTYKNAFQLYEFARGLKLPADHRIYDRCLKLIMQNYGSVTEDPSFCDIELSTLMMMLNFQSYFQTSKTQLFESIMRWARKECERKTLIPSNENLRSVVDPALKKIDFLTFSATEFAIGPAESGILTESESFSILMNIAKNSEFPMPEGFFTEKPEDYPKDVLVIHTKKYAPKYTVHNAQLPSANSVQRSTQYETWDDGNRGDRCDLELEMSILCKIFEEQD